MSYANAGAWFGGGVGGLYAIFGSGLFAKVAVVGGAITGPIGWAIAGTVAIAGLGVATCSGAGAALDEKGENQRDWARKKGVTEEILKECANSQQKTREAYESIMKSNNETLRQIHEESERLRKEINDAERKKNSYVLGTKEYLDAEQREADLRRELHLINLRKLKNEEDIREVSKSFFESMKGYQEVNQEAVKNWGDKLTWSSPFNWGIILVGIVIFFSLSNAVERFLTRKRNSEGKIGGKKKNFLKW